MAVLGTNTDPGIGVDAAKVVADSIHSSHVKEMGLVLLQKDSDLTEGESNNEFAWEFDQLSEDETTRLQLKMARLVVVFLELLHILIARNRDMLLEVIQERKKGEASSRGGGGLGGSSSLGVVRPNSAVGTISVQTGTDRGTDRGTDKSISSGTLREQVRRLTPVTVGVPKRAHSTGEPSVKLEGESKKRTYHHGRVHSDENSYHSSSGLRTDSAIAVQSELQRAFINLTKTLYPRLQDILQSATPRWLKQCSQENYFSMGYYRHTKIPVAEELCLRPSDMAAEELRAPLGGQRHFDGGYESPRGSIGGGSSHSIVSRGSERYGFGQF